MNDSTRATPLVWGVPDPPVPHVPHRDRDPLILILTNENTSKLAPAPTSGRVNANVLKLGLYGTAGVGKTVLAAIIAHTPRVKAQFPDGVFWLDMGRLPQLARLQMQLARAAGANLETFANLSAGKHFLEQWFINKRALLILDDVHVLDHAAAFDILGPSGHLLMTTRDRDLIHRFGAVEYRLGTHDGQTATALLTAHLQPNTDIGNRTEHLAHACGNVSLAIAAIAASMRSRGASIDDALQWLGYTGAASPNTAMGPIHPSARHAIGIALDRWCSQAGIDELDIDVDGRRTCYLDLGALPDDTSVSRARLRILWSRHGMDDARSDALIASLVRHHLLQDVSSEARTRGLRLHELCRVHIVERVPDLADKHRAFIDAHVAHIHDLAAKYDDDYLVQWLPFHLASANRIAELQRVLSDYGWLDNKLRREGIASLLSDYNLVLTPENSRKQVDIDNGMLSIRDALLDASDVLNHDPNQLASQILGRLAHPAVADTSPAVQRLLLQATQQRDSARLHPIFPCLKPPGGPLLGTLDGHTSWVHAVTVTPDGTRAISAAEDHTIKVWDLASRVELYTLFGHTSNINAVAVSPDGTRVLSASSDKTVIVWDLEHGVALGRLSGHARGVNDVIVTPDGTRAITASRDRTIKVWDMQTLQPVQTLRGHSDYVRTLSVTKDNTIISGSRDHTLKIWDLNTGIERHTLTGHTGWVDAVTATPDGKRAVSASEDQTLRVWNLADGAELSVLRGHARWVTDVTVTPDGRRAISSSRDQTLKVWDIEAGAQLGTLAGHRRWVNAVAVTPDGMRAVSASRDRTLKIWNLERGTGLRNVAGHAGWVNAVAPTPDGTRIISASNDRTLRFWDIATGGETRAVSGHDLGINAIAVTPDGATLVSASRDQTLIAWDIDSGTKRATMSGHTLGVVSVAVTPDGTRAISASSDKSVRVWDIESGAELQTITGHTGWINAVTVTADGSRIVTASEDSSIKVWDSASGAEIFTLRGHENEVVAIATTPDDKYIVSASGDKTLRIWDLRTGTALDVLSACSRWVNAIAITPDGNRLVAVSSEKYAEVWDISARKRLVRFTGDSAMLCCTANLSDDRVVVGDTSGRVLFLQFMPPSDSS